MARRSRKKNHSKSPTNIILGTIAALLAVAIGFVLIGKKDQPSAKSFPLEVYVNNCNSLRGSTYTISGEIIQNAEHDPSIGKFIFLRVNTDDQDIPPNTPKNVGILVPAEIDGPNLETKQKYQFIVDVKKEGQLVAHSYTAN